MADHILETIRLLIYCDYSIILLIKLGLWINAAYYFEDQRRLLIRLAPVMFHRTPYHERSLVFPEFQECLEFRNVANKIWLLIGI